MIRVVQMAAVCGLTALAGCDILGPTACTSEFVYGVRVEAYSATDGSPVSQGLSGTLIHGSYIEDMEGYANGLWGAGERPGIYEVTVAATGFAPWERSGVRVTENECHVEPVELRAELEPSA